MGRGFVERLRRGMDTEETLGRENLLVGEICWSEDPRGAKKQLVKAGVPMQYFLSVKRHGPLLLGVFIGMILMAFLIEGYHASAEPAVCIACHSMSQVGADWHMANKKSRLLRGIPHAGIGRS